MHFDRAYHVGLLEGLEAPNSGNGRRALCASAFRVVEGVNTHDYPDRHFKSQNVHKGIDSQNGGNGRSALCGSAFRIAEGVNTRDYPDRHFQGSNLG